MRRMAGSALLLVLVLSCTAVHAGRIVVNHDEWTLSNTGYASAGAANAGAFAQNVAAFMNIAGGAGSFLIYSANFGLTQASFQGSLTTAGHSVTVNTAIAFTLANLSAYDGIFLGGSSHSATDAVLTSYVNSGGSVYIAAGTGVGGAVAEAARWNGFLNAFGLSLASSYNGCCGVDPVEGTHSIFAGVNQLFYDNGNTVSLFGANPNAQVVEFRSTTGLIGVYDDVPVNPVVPEPATITTLVLGLGALAGKLRRRKA